MSAAAGESVLRTAVAAAERLWPERMAATFALGSLAHGGFAPLASDVDLALIFADDALVPGDLGPVLREALLGDPDVDPELAGRLSVFSSTWAMLAQARGQEVETLGRFPAIDRLDLAQHGRQLTGVDRREVMAWPTPAELLHDSAAFLTGRFANPDQAALMRDPDLLVARGVRPVTKVVLFPVRFVYTAQAGRADGNAPDVQHYVRTVDGPSADLAAAALRWRTDGLPEDGSAVELLRAGLPELVSVLIEAYRPHLSPSKLAALSAILAL